MSLLMLRDQVSWFGSHSGYEQLTRYLSNGYGGLIVAPRSGRVARYLGSAYARLQGRVGRGSSDLCEWEFHWRRKFSRPRTSHVLNLENHLNVLAGRSKASKDLVGTIHLPASVWNQEQCALLSRLASALVLFERDIPFYEKYVGAGRVKFIHHGVDTEFFKPGPAKLRTPPRILYSGVYLRNEAMLVRVVKRLAEQMPDLRFDLLVPVHHRKSAALAPLQEHPAITWHGGLNDEELRALYQRSYLMLLPMNESGANTAVVEALASGLPLVTTDVGGIRNYGGETVFPVVANNNDDGIVELVGHYLSKLAWRDEIGRRCRQFSEDVLAWPLVARMHLKAYQEFLA